MEPKVVTTDKMRKPYTAPAKQIWGWGVGRVAEYSLVAMFGQAMNIFTVGFGLSPVIVSWCMMLPRLVDGIVDPIIGHWSDDTHTRWGRRKPFLIGGAFIGSIFLAGLWWASPGWSPAAQFLFLGIVGMCLYICYGTYTMAWNAIGYELSDDYHERAKVQAIQGFFLAIMALLYSWVYWLALRPGFGGVVWGMRWIGGIAALMVIVTSTICAVTARERFTHTNRTHVPLIPAIKATIRNRPFVFLILMKIGEILGGRLVGGLTFYLGVYYTCRGDLDLSTRIAGIGATLGSIWNFVMLPLVKPASKKMGKRGALIMGAGLGFVCALVNPFVTTPEHPYWSMIPALVVAPLLVITTTIAAAILPDICDVDELHTGQRREGLFTSVMAFISKLEISLAIILVGYIVSLSQVDMKINQRWESVVAGTATNGVVIFPAGELAVFGFKDKAVATFDTVRVESGNLQEIELSASTNTSTTGFQSIGRFVLEEARTELKFVPVTAKFIKIQLCAARESGRPVELRSFSVGQENLLAAGKGGKLLASQPPPPIQKRLFWMVMIMYIIFSGFTLLMAILFPLTEATMKEVRQKLDERHHKLALAGHPVDDAQGDAH